MKRDPIRAASRLLRPSDEPPPFASELEPCLFYRVTPVAGPLLGLAVAALTLLVVLGSAATAGSIPWLATIAGLGTALFCAILPRTAGLWPGSEALTDWEVALDQRLHRHRGLRSR